MEEADASKLDAWRQGSILRRAQATGLGLITEEQAADHCVVVISHDCDIANTTPGLEPDVEVIVAKVVPTNDGSLTGGKNSRKLHLQWDHAEGPPRILELRATNKRGLSKTQLLMDQPDPDYRLESTSTGLFVLRFWLGARYNRSAFPTEFNNRLDRTKTLAAIVRVLKDHPQVTGVYLNLSTTDELPSVDPAPYVIDIFLAFHGGEDPVEAQSKSDEAAEAIEAVFAKLCFMKGAWEWLRLKSCIAISEEDFPVARAKQLQAMALDYLSLRAEPLAPTPIGVMNR